jgi:thymidylate kinase
MIAGASVAEPRRILVEFVGAAGVGKSFLTAKLVGELQKRRLPVIDLARTPIKRSAPQNWAIAVAKTLAALELMPRSFSAYLATAKRLAKHEIRAAECRQDTAIFVLDEGIFQKIRAFYRNSRATDMLQITERVLRHASFPDVVVVVEGTVERVLTQRSQRKGRSTKFNRASIRNDVLLVADTIRTIEHTQRRSPGLRMLRINIECDDIGAAIDCLANLLEARFRNTGTTES